MADSNPRLAHPVFVRCIDRKNFRIDFYFGAELVAVEMTEPTFRDLHDKMSLYVGPPRVQQPEEYRLPEGAEALLSAEPRGTS
jgi:hypothetical protein